MSKGTLPCFVNGCNNRQGNKDNPKSFYRFPAVIKHQGQEIEHLTTKRRGAWIAAIGRKKEPSIWSRICADHFLDGKPAKLTDVGHPDWAPSIRLRHDERTKDEVAKSVLSSQKKLKRFERKADRDDRKTQLAAAEALVDLSSGNDESSATEERQETVSDVVNSLREENERLKTRLNHVEINVESFKDNNEKVLFYTGLPTFLTLMTLFDLLSPFIPIGVMSKLTKFQKFVLVLIKLRLNLPVIDLGYRFNVSPSTVSYIFKTVLHVMYVRLRPHIRWPDRDQLKKTMPMSFRKYFGLKVVSIIDCFELYVDRPSTLFNQSQLWSNYKHCHTVKFLISICPTGSVSFISQGFAGRASDKYVTENSKFLNNILPGDVILADRGFNISDTVGLLNAKVELPAFTKGKNQLSPYDVENTRKIANSRIHVERLIGFVKNKYSILQKGKIPIDYLVCDEDGVPVIDKIVTVSCVLSNICQSIIPNN